MYFSNNSNDFTNNTNPYFQPYPAFANMSSNNPNDHQHQQPYPSHLHQPSQHPGRVVEIPVRHFPVNTANISPPGTFRTSQLPQPQYHQPYYPQPTQGYTSLPQQRNTLFDDFNTPFGMSLFISVQSLLSVQSFSNNFKKILERDQNPLSSSVPRILSLL
jgi:hypothetical protein